MEVLIPMFNKRNYWLGCDSAHILSFYKFKGFPIDLIFYNALEKIQDIFEYFLNKISQVDEIDHTIIRRGYKPDFLANISMLGLTTSINHSIHFDEVEEMIIKTLKEGNIVLLTAQTFFLEHHVNHFKVKYGAGGHYIVLTEYNDSLNEYTIYDENKNLKNYTPYRLNKSIIKDAYSASSHTIITVNNENKIDYDEIKNTIKSHFNFWIANVSKTNSSYEGIIHFLLNKSRTVFINEILILTNTFALIRGLRSLFLEFLIKIGCPERIYKKIFPIIECLETLENMTLRNYYTKTEIDLKKVIKNCNSLSNEEFQLYIELKEWCNNF